MRIRHLEVEGFRGLHSIEVEFDPRLTVLVGRNGSGKTTILDALSILLSQYTARLVKTASSARRLTDSDINGEVGYTALRLNAEDDGAGSVGWSLLKTGSRERLLRPRGSDFTGLNEFVRQIAARQPDGDDYLRGETAPIFYDQRRAVLDIPRRKRTAPNHVPAIALSEGLNFGGIDFRKLTYWFQERETVELRRQRSEPLFVDRQLEAVRRAMTTATGFADPHYSIERPRGIAILKGHERLAFEQLSTGEQVFIALAGDLARRLAILSPEGDDPLNGCALVLIDEVELHLHPGWQRRFVPWLVKTFPGCQFVLSTHSPQVLGEVQARQVRVLQARGSRIEVRTPDATFGRDSNYLLEGVLGADERDTMSKRLLRQVDDAMNGRDYTRAGTLIARLRRTVEGSPPELSLAEARLNRRLRTPA